MSRIRVLSPVGEVRREAFAAPPLPADLAGLTVGFIDNTKHNFDRLADEIGAILRDRHGVKEVVRRRKANASNSSRCSAARRPKTQVGRRLVLLVLRPI